MIRHVILYTHSPRTHGSRFLAIGLGVVAIILIAIHYGA